MNAKEKSSRAGPFLFGLAFGVAGAFAVGLWTGWATTGSVRDVQVSQARVDGQARVCQAQALADRKERGDTRDLRGFGNDASEARMALARAFTMPLLGSQRPDDIAVRACADLLNSVT